MAFILAKREPRRFGLLSYSTQNLGDEIQSIAARRFLPRVDALIDRDALNRRGRLRASPLKLILNGWLTERPDNWPPHPSIAPLLISLHLSDAGRGPGFSAAEALVVGRNAAYLRAHGPVGARDVWTLDLLQRNGIDSYFSGCLSLTLEHPQVVCNSGYVVLNDMGEDIAAAAQRRTHAQVISTRHEDTWTRGFRGRMDAAEKLLRAYAGARCVITSRLHCALPCLAMGTPVLFIPPREDSKRLGGLVELVRHCTPAEFLSDEVDFDLDHPPHNPDRHLPLRAALIERCSTFIDSDALSKRA